MEQYIPKSVVVAEIEKKIKQYEKAFDSPTFASYEASLIAKGKYRKLLDILQFLDTLEVKEVDLEKEIDKFYGMYRKNGITFSIEDNQECLDWKVDCNPNFEKAFAKHFFELGMAVSNKAQKGE